MFENREQPAVAPPLETPITIYAMHAFPRQPGLTFRTLAREDLPGLKALQVVTLPLSR
jgi:hypothetical protein